MFKPKLCCLINPSIKCFCGFALCAKHLDKLNGHISPRINTPYYSYCHKDFAVVWYDDSERPTRYRLAFREGYEN